MVIMDGSEDLNLVELNFGNIIESQNWTLYKDIIQIPLHSPLSLAQ